MSRDDRAVLALEDGSLFEGRAFGARGRAEGEVVFNTSMTGYQEILTDPSYHGQLVVMTCPHVGNTGVNDEDSESDRVRVAGFAARRFSRRSSSWRARRDLEDWLREEGVVAIDEIDTRRLTRRLREKGCLRGVLASGASLGELSTADALVAAARAVPDPAAQDLVREVTSPRRYEWRPERRRPGGAGFPGPTLALLDCGMKRSIARALHARGVRLVVLPATASAAEILALEADGLLVTNGPGDPRSARYAVETVRALLGRLPMLGICLGHQLLALAAGAATFPLKFGHHGANHPVRDERTGRVAITSQNHNYAVDARSAEAVGFEVTHRSLFDGTVEGMIHRGLALRSVQYHPEAAPGPSDAEPLFEEFLDHLAGRVR